MSISRTAKDTVNKFIVHRFRDGALAWFGIESLKIVEPISAEVTHVDIKQDMLDLVMRLEDDSLLHLEFQSTRESSLHRFLRYDAHLLYEHRRPIRAIVVYTVRTQTAPEQLDAGCLKYRVENVYLYDRDGAHALASIQAHLEQGLWTLDDELNLAFLVFMKNTPRNIVDIIIGLLKQIPDESSKRRTAAMFCGLAVTQLSEEQLRRIEGEFQVRNIMVELVEEQLRKEHQEGKWEGLQEVAKKLLCRGNSVTETAELTGLSEKEIEHIKAEMDKSISS